MLHRRHTTAMSHNRIGRPASRRCHASGLWSAWSSCVDPQSEQNGCNRLARLLSRCHAASYPRAAGLASGAQFDLARGMVQSTHRVSCCGSPHLTHGLSTPAVMCPAPRPAGWAGRSRGWRRSRWLSPGMPWRGRRRGWGCVAGRPWPAGGRRRAPAGRRSHQ